MTFDLRQILGTVLLVFALVYGGWYGHGVYDGYLENQAKSVQEIVKDGMKSIEDRNSKDLEGLKTDMGNLKTNTIEKQIPIIVNNPIYKEVCTDANGIDLLQQYKDQSNAIRRAGGTK